MSDRELAKSLIDHTPENKIPLLIDYMKSVISPSERVPYSDRTPDERQIIDKVWEFEDYYGDMLFLPGTSVNELLKCSELNPDSGEWEDVTESSPFEYFNYLSYRYTREPLEDGTDGCFNSCTKTLHISSKAEDFDCTLLHELIHLHESILENAPSYFHDMLFWALYTDLRLKIPKLDEIITSHAHILNGEQLYLLGGGHDTLFLLKSFDLDIRQNYPLGTIFGYGRVEDFKDYSYDCN